MQLLQIRERIRAALTALADRGMCVNGGYFLGSADYEPMVELLVTIDGREYSVQISEAGSDDD
jgi:hypothetical protein